MENVNKHWPMLVKVQKRFFFFFLNVKKKLKKNTYKVEKMRYRGKK